MWALRPDLCTWTSLEGSHHCLWGPAFPGPAGSPGLGAQAVWTSQGLVLTQPDQGIPVLHVLSLGGEAWVWLLASLHFLFALFSTTASSPRGPHSLLPACWPLARLVVRCRCYQCSITKPLVLSFPSSAWSLFPQNGASGTSCHQLQSL